MRFIIRKRSYRACTARIYKSCKYWIGQSLLRNDKSSPRTVKSRIQPISLSLVDPYILQIIYHIFLSFVSDDKFNSVLEYDCSLFCCCVLLWPSSRRLVFRSESKRNDRENWISILDFVLQVINLIVQLRQGTVVYEFDLIFKEHIELIMNCIS